jgi:EmrB/QacA subfamily drug resistance transporter
VAVHLLKAPCDAAVIRSAPEVAPCSPRVGSWVLVATILGSSLVFIDANVVNVALPAIQADLHANAGDTQWVFEAYSLFLGALLMVGGSLGDRYGRRRIFLVGTVLFAIASAASGLSLNIGQVIAARTLQGVGGALLTPGSLAILSATFSQAQRGRAIGTWSGATAVASGIGPALGGFVVDHASWRWVFFINLPLAVLVVLITSLRVPESRDPGTARLDWLGSLTCTIGLAGIVFGLIQSGTLGLDHPLVLGSLAVGLVSLAAFALVEARSPAPMMPLDLFRSRAFAGANLLTLLLYGAMSGALFFLPFNLIQVQGYPATAAGASLVPYIVLMSLLSRWSGGLVTRYGARLPLLAGPIIAAIAFALLAVPGVGGSYWTTFFPGLTVLGLALAITVAPLSTTVMGAVDERHVGVASGINNAVARVAGLLAIAAMSVIIVFAFSSALEARLTQLHLPPNVSQAIDTQRVRLAAIEVPPGLPVGEATTIRQAIGESFVTGFRVVCWAAAGLALAGALIAWLTIGTERSVGPSGPSRR